MPTWTKPTITPTADVSNQSLRASLYFSDDAADPPNELRIAIDIDYVEAAVKKTETIDRPITDCGLNAAEQTTLKQLMAKVRDNALAAGGWTEQ